MSAEQIKDRKQMLNNYYLGNQYNNEQKQR